MLFIVIIIVIITITTVIISFRIIFRLSSLLAFCFYQPSFFLSMFPELLNLTGDSEERDSVKIRCTCGKNVKDPKKIACTTSKCPCNRNGEGCSRRCRCYNCKNQKMRIKRQRNQLLRSANETVDVNAATP